MKYSKEAVVNVLDSLKEKMYNFVDDISDITDDERALLLINTGLNLICQIITEHALPMHHCIKQGFDEFIVDMTIWRDSYLENNPEKDPVDVLKEISARLNPKKPISMKN